MKKFKYLLFVTVGVYGQQQEPSLTQYMYNFGLINPAYTVNYPGLTKGGILFNKSLLGVEGSPYTTTMFVHSQISRNVEGGINLIHDSVGKGLITKTSFNGDLGYSVNISKKLKVSFGVKYGVLAYNINANKINSSGSVFDNVLQNDSNTFQQLGLGVFLFSKKFFLGLSTTDVLLDRTPQYKEVYNFYGIAGYAFRVNKSWVIKPMIMTELSQNGNPIINTSLLANYNKNLEFGVFYRPTSTIGGMINCKIYKAFRFAYSYTQLLNKLGSYSYGTHQFGILINTSSWKQSQKNLF